MKKVISVCLIVLLTVGLFSCSEPKEVETESTALGTTEKVAYPYEIPDPALLRPQDRVDFFVETEDYNYYLYQEKLYFSTKEDTSFYYLCGKPDCPHGGNNCNAYTGCAFGWWDGKLYGVCDDDNLDLVAFSMEMDGSNHNVIAKIEMPLDANGQYGGCYSFFFNKGYLYYEVLATPNSYFRVDLSTGETTRLFEETLKDGSGVYNWRFSGDELYCLLTDVEQGLSLCRLCGTELETVFDWEFGTVRWDIEGDTLFFYSADRQAFCEYCITTGTMTEKLAFSAINGSAYYHSDYIYLITWENFDEEQTMYFFDWNYQLLDKLELAPMQDWLFAAGDKLYFTNMPSQPITYYIPKSAIGTGKLELIEVTNPYSYR